MRNYYFNTNHAQGQVNNDSNIMHISKKMSTFCIFMVLSSAIIPSDHRNSRESISVAYRYNSELNPLIKIIKILGNKKKNSICVGIAASRA